MATVRAAAPPEVVARRHRSGRDLPVAIGVGLSLGVLLTVPLYLYKPVFVAVVAVAAGYGVVELGRALGAGGVRPPLVPLVVGGTTTVAVAYPFGTDAVATSLGLTVVAVIAWRLVAAVAAPPPVGDARALGHGWLVRDLAAAMLALAYVPFLASFAVLLVVPSDGPRRVTAFIATCVCSDVGGFAAGVLSGGRHKMAPTISPGKSWEGFVGSVLVCVAAGVVFLGPVLHHHWWQGVLYGLAVAVTATVGDLGESVMKRDLGIKDMGRLLPGHGGLLDRLDSLLLTAPVAWLLLTVFAPLTS